MPSFRTDNVLECSERTYWDKVLLDDEYNRRLFFEELHFSAWQELERKEAEGRVTRLVKAVPYIGDVPGALKAVIGEGVGYEERGTLLLLSNRYEASATPNRLADKISITIVMATSPLGDGRCRLVVDGSVTARIFAVGGLLEQRMVADLRRSYEKGAEFTNRFVGERGLR